MKRVLFVIISLFLLWTAKANDIYVVTANRLNVRMSPSTTARVLGRVVKGDTLEVTDIVNSVWAKIEFKNREGYVSTKYIRFVRSLQPEPSDPEPVEVLVQEVPVQVDTIEVKEEIPDESPKDDISTLISGPCKINKNFELYYGVSAGVGFSSFLWEGSLENGRLSYSGDIFAELNFNEKVLIFPKNYFVELQLGYDSKGAAWYSMNYVHAKLYPLGYKIPIDSLKIVGKAGPCFGMPLSDFESHDTGRTWSGCFQVGIAAAIGIEYKQFCLSANVEYDFTEVADTPVTLNNLAVFGTLSYKIGKFKH